jgi:hypothetical protein
MTVSDLLTTNYEQRAMNYEIKNKPNTKPIQSQYKPNPKPIQTQFKPKQTQFRPDLHQFLLACGKVNFQPQNIDDSVQIGNIVGNVCFAYIKTVFFGRYRP